MDVIFLGTNGWYDSPAGNTICILIESEDYYIILDAGNGIHKLDRYYQKAKPVFILLSHFHLDHIIGLHILAKFSFAKGLVIAGPKGTKEILKTIVNKPFTMPLDDLPYKTEVLELSEEDTVLPFETKCMELVHSSLTLGYRIHLENKSVAYIPDTGFCQNAVRLARNVDLVIAECAHLPGESSPEWPHLNPQDAANIAKEAGAKQLALVHFDARRYPTTESRKVAQLCAKNIFPNTIATHDEMHLRL
ncbi:MAG: MBL fold metallo-hydrolase [Pseudomonadota bacterium]|uniref:MBL fold metallo-hydrolase n=1 Tax=Candidatus Desulfatibia profunda TaxID=2841695 RepID=A0A8J6NT68_9BACT|nr:MBL fold metallo-hydrolase [Candidatus Desulfatibia profunda]MBL7179303.1 MBL fold metallo-hydrolase [Desulfobacterales bacterium]